jgi:hypothetical protein
MVGSRAGRGSLGPCSGNWSVAASRLDEAHNGSRYGIAVQEVLGRRFEEFAELLGSVIVGSNHATI